MSGVPYTFGTATTSIPLSNLDSNFVTPVTIGNASVALGNTISTIGNLTLNNVTINSGTSNIASGGNVTIGNTTITLGNTATSLGNVTLANSTINFAASLSLGNSTVNTALGQGNASIMKNRIINGNFMISQYNGSSSTTPTGSTYIIDRWRLIVAASSKLSVQQNAGSVTTPVGFPNYLGLTSLAATTVAAGDEYVLYQKIEGFNTADLGWGTANAKTVTLSFQVYSSLTGTFGGAINNSDQSRSYPFSYSIPVANTWTTISVTVAGDTTGTWIGATNGTGMVVRFGLGVGSTYSGTAGSWSGNAYDSTTGAVQVVATNGATFYITGVQLEVGSSATGFDYRPYGTELMLCQRYYEIAGSGIVGIPNSATVIYAVINYKVDKRATPSLSISTTTPLCRQFSLGDRTGSGSTASTAYADSSSGTFAITGFSGVTTGSPGAFNTAGLFQLSAEL